MTDYTKPINKKTLQQQILQKAIQRGVKKTTQLISRTQKRWDTNRQQKIDKDRRLIAKHGYGYDPDKIRQRQQELVKAGYKIAVDGDWGPQSKQAWQNYTKDIQIPSTPVDRLGNKTLECATFSNTWMRNNGINAGGDAYQVGRHYSPVINGYDGIHFQRGASRAQIMNYHREAADEVKKDLDTTILQKWHMYPVNMYYNTSPHMKEFYRKSLDENTQTPGTHTGVLYNNGNQWMVGHNIHGTILNNPVSDVLGGRSNPNKYGITAIYDAGAVKWHPDKKQDSDKKEPPSTDKKGLLGLGFLGL